MDDAPKLTIDELIEWGRDWERLLGNGARGQGFDGGGRCCSNTSSPPTRRWRRSSSASRNRKEPRSRGGRPPGGMGEQKVRTS